MLKFVCALIVLFSSAGAFAQSFHLKAVRVADGKVLGPIYINDTVATLNSTGGAIPTFLLDDSELLRVTPDVEQRAFVNFLPVTPFNDCFTTGNLTFNVSTENPCAQATPFQLSDNGTLTFGKGGMFQVCGGQSVSTIGYTSSNTTGLGCDAITLVRIDQPSEFSLEAVLVSNNTVLGPVYVTNDSVATLTVTGDPPLFSLFPDKSLVDTRPGIVTLTAFINFIFAPFTCSPTGIITFNASTINPGPCAKSTPFQLLDNVTLTFGTNGTFQVCGGENMSTVGYTNNTNPALGCEAIRLLAL